MLGGTSTQNAVEDREGDEDDCTLELSPDDMSAEHHECPTSPGASVGLWAGSSLQ